MIPTLLDDEIKKYNNDNYEENLSFFEIVRHALTTTLGIVAVVVIINIIIIITIITVVTISIANIAIVITTIN